MTTVPGSNQNVPTPAVSAIHKGLTSLGKSASQIVGHIQANPGNLGAMVEAGKALREQFGNLIDCAETFDKSATKLKMTTEETTKAADWIGGNFRSNQDVPLVNHLFGRMVDFT